MDWININDELPEKYEEVIVATLDGSVKAATHTGSGKFSTYLTITHWMHMPKAPEKSVVDGEVEEVQVVQKRRGRPKKNVEVID